MDAIWIDRFNDEWTDDELDDLIRVSARPIVVGRATAEEDAKRFETAAKKIFVPGPQERALIRAVLARVRAHATLFFTTEQAYLAGVHGAAKPWGDDWYSPIILSGLAGVGKSELLKALGRVLSRVYIVDVHPLKNIRLVSHWPLSLTQGRTMKSLVERYLPGIHLVRNTDPSLYVRNRTWAEAVGLISTDEFQLVTKSAGANTRAVQLMMEIVAMGPLSLFSLNYSMIHKIKKRYSEDQHRLLQDPILMHPCDPDCTSWRSFIDALLSLNRPVFDVGLAKATETIHRYTFGIRRHAVTLLKQAYLTARSRGRKFVSIDDIHSAYHSLEYAAFRVEVEALSGVDSQLFRKRLDLQCPFPGLSVKSGLVPVHDRPDAEKVAEEISREVNDKLFYSAMTMAERATVNDGYPYEKRPKMSKGRGRRRSITKEELLRDPV